MPARPSSSQPPRRPSSSARLAAEAAFAPEPVPATAQAKPPEVVVKRKRALDPGAIHEPGSQTGGDEGTARREDRSPKVYRVEAPAEGATREEGGGAHPPAVELAQRRRRRATPGERRPSEVKVFRPASAAERPSNDDASAADDPAASAASEAPSLSDLARRLVEIDAEILALRREAQKARRAESAEAVRWIKRAIAEYGLTAADLGY